MKGANKMKKKRFGTNRNSKNIKQLSILDSMNGSNRRLDTTEESD